MNPVRPFVTLVAITLGVLIFSETLGLIHFSSTTQEFSLEGAEPSEKIESSESDSDPLSQQEQELQEKYDELLKENEAINTDRKNIMTQAKMLLGQRSRAEELTIALEKIKNDLAVLEKEKQEIQNTNLRLEGELKKLQEAQAELTKERDDFKLAYEEAKKDTAIKELEKELASLGEKKSGLEGSLKKKNNKIEQLKMQITRLEETYEQLTQQVKEQKETIAEALKKNTALEEEVENIPKKFSEIARQNKMLIRDTAQMHYNMGVFYTKNKKYNRAIAEFEKALQITPDDASAHFNLGYIYAEHSANRKKAIEHFRHFLRLAKSNDKDIDWVRKYLLTWEAYDGKRPIS